jgi:hypothetical protein
MRINDKIYSITPLQKPQDESNDSNYIMITQYRATYGFSSCGYHDHPTNYITYGFDFFLRYIPFAMRLDIYF